LRRTFGILDAALDPAQEGHDAARRIAEHDHFKVLYQLHPDDMRVNPEAGKAIFEAAQAKFGAENVRRDWYTQKRQPTLFPVLRKDGRITSAEQLSEVLQHLPVVDLDYVFIHPDLCPNALLTQLAEQLGDRGSWCGETHLQKATYFLQDLLGVPVGVEFILYKHGPYSFDLTEELTWLQAKLLLEKDYRSPGYGPGLRPTETSRDLRSRFPVTLGSYARPIDFVASAFGTKGGAVLEKLATALYVTRELGEAADLGQRAQSLFQKPYAARFG
jgi:hypothetical protein